MAGVIFLALVYFIVGAIGLWAGSETENKLVPYSEQCVELNKECVVNFSLESEMEAPVYVTLPVN